MQHSILSILASGVILSALSSAAIAQDYPQASPYGYGQQPYLQQDGYGQYPSQQPAMPATSRSDSSVPFNKVGRIYIGMDYTYTSLIGKDKGSYSTHNYGSGVRPYAGYQFHKNFVAESGYFYVPREDSGNGFSRNNTLTGITLDLVGSYPLTPNFDLLGSVGYAYITSDFNAAISVDSFGNSTIVSDKISESAFRLGLGGQYKFTNAIAARGMVNYGNTSDVGFI